MVLLGCSSLIALLIAGTFFRYAQPMAKQARLRPLWRHLRQFALAWLILSGYYAASFFLSLGFYPADISKWPLDLTAPIWAYAYHLVAMLACGYTNVLLGRAVASLEDLEAPHLTPVDASELANRLLPPRKRWQVIEAVDRLLLIVTDRSAIQAAFLIGVVLLLQPLLVSQGIFTPTAWAYLAPAIEWAYLVQLFVASALFTRLAILYFVHTRVWAYPVVNILYALLQLPYAFKDLIPIQMATYQLLLSGAKLAVGCSAFFAVATMRKHLQSRPTSTLDVEIGATPSLPLWERPNDGSEIVAHLSDLHFGIPKAFGSADRFDRCWTVLADHLKQQVAPRCVLITGDIVDTPKEILYKKAFESLERLALTYWVCPGNHDRHFHGNVFWKRRWSKEAALFDQIFQDRQVGWGRPTTEAVGSWNVGLLGLDSSVNSDFFARGYVDASVFSGVKKVVARHTTSASREPKEGEAPILHWDLLILMIHHHVQPVRALEKAHGGVLTRLANVTTLINAGTFLEALADAHVDLVLHGHEHAVHSGIYGSLELGRREVCVLGAASATGASTLEGCQEERISYNEILLAPDRSVRVRVVGFDGEQWRIVKELPLYTSSATRRLQLLRRSPHIVAPLASQVTKHVEFARDRSILVHWSYGNWILSSQLGLDVENSTGRPTNGRVRISRMLDSNVAFQTDVVFHRREKAGNWFFKIPTPPDLQGTPVRLDISLSWEAGGVLTAAEASALQETQAPGRLRAEGYEFATVWTDPDIAVSAAQLLVVLPRDLDPERVIIRVYDALGGERSRAAGDLADRLTRLGPGRYSLVVPFPLPGWHYCIAWRPVAVDPGPEAGRFVEYARSNGDDLLQSLDAELPRNITTDGRLSLYVAEGRTARRVGHKNLSAVHGAEWPAARIALLEFPPGPIQHAFWGSQVLAIHPGPENDAIAARLGLLPDEHALIACPVGMAYGWAMDDPFAVVRLGLRDSAAAAVARGLPPKELQRALSGPILRMVLSVPAER